ncbi:MAG: thioesterase family protein [bacterium]|nr:thioesterase family protein [bacterium]
MTHSTAAVRVPTFGQVDELPQTLIMSVPDSYLDINHHMNIRHYLAVHDRAFGYLFTAMGFGSDYIKGRGLSFFQVENHIRYLAEAHGGDEISVHVRLIGRTARAIHGVSFLLNRSRGTVANTLEFLMLHVDLRTRKAVDFDTRSTELLDRRMADDSVTTWPAPLSGCVHLKRP